MKPTYRLFYNDDGLFISWTGEDIRERLQKAIRGVALNEARLDAPVTRGRRWWEVSVGGKRAQEVTELIQKELILSHTADIRTKTGWTQLRPEDGQALAPSQRGKADK